MNVERVYLSAKQRWLDAGYPNYAWWVPVLFHSFTAVAALIAVAQRLPGSDAAAAAALLAVPMAVYFGAEIWGPRLPWFLFAAGAFIPIGVLRYTDPRDFDFLLLVLALLIGRFAACESLRRGLAILAAVVGGMIGLGFVQGFDGTGFAVALVIAGFDLGWLLQTQQRRIDQQEVEQEQRELTAALAERQRIAREVHDVVAHSLSVTLLHLTAARRDLEDDGDVSEAIEALKDAEQIGRQAMTDIRATVGLLNDETGELRATPDLGDVPALVQQFRAAGLDVAYESAGDHAMLTAAEGTGLYRIVQESLANIAKHEPSASATVTLDLSADPARLAVRNSLTHPVAAPNGGSGLRGMRERATHLGARFEAGPVGNSWQVLVELANPHAHNCPLPKLRRPQTSPETA
ncbi:MAG TPA: histidine kinase [Nocardioidaceae bacterium]|nr:histidine kinase [Nocardioidaceae bacterium]